MSRLLTEIGSFFAITIVEPRAQQPDFLPVITCVDVFGRSKVLPAVVQADGLEVAIQGLPTGLFQINVTVNDCKYVGKFVRMPQ
ncbi:MAG: hypothetical protein SFV52_13910 [Saprospiraceae bacterium]|nr:hypothetical protein [Saprospiraceae bacterium]